MAASHGIVAAAFGRMSAKTLLGGWVASGPSVFPSLVRETDCSEGWGGVMEMTTVDDAEAEVV